MKMTRAFQAAAADVRTARPVVELQSFRGIAAVIVLVYHCGLYFDYGASAQLAMSLLFNAQAAVVSFFVLSGFVLTLALMRAPAGSRSLLDFYVRRLFRIYPALWAACILALVYLVVIGPEATAFGTPWARSQCGTWPLSLAKIASAFLAWEPTLPLPIWTLTIELIGSFALPLVVAAMMRSTLALIAALVAAAILSLTSRGTPLIIPVYLVDFVIGAALALTVPWLRRVLVGQRSVLLCTTLGIALVWGARIATRAGFHTAYNDPVTSLLEAIGAAMLIGAIYVRADAFAWLSGRRLTSLGDHSYSLYLLHQPILSILAAVAVFAAPVMVVNHPALVTIALMAGTLALTLPLAGLLYRHVELPMIAIGRSATTRLAYADGR